MDRGSLGICGDILGTCQVEKVPDGETLVRRKVCMSDTQAVLVVVK